MQYNDMAVSNGYNDMYGQRDEMRFGNMGKSFFEV
jgi:hypothetical protein